jgi:hypothetical protein
MASKKKSKKPAPKKPAPKKPAPKGPPIPTGQATVACWEDDPGEPQSQPALTPITVPAPNQSATPLPFKISDAAPAPQIYQPGTTSFLYYAAACALRRTADFWGSVVPKGTSWQVGKVLPVALDSGVDLNAFYTRGDGGDAPGLHFFHDTVKGRVYFSGESPDVTCHEMGHAILDALRPQLWDAQSIEAAAFHESMGDMSGMLSALQVPSFRAQLLTETDGTVNRASRLSRLAEQLGAAIRVQHPDAVDSDCLRNAVNSFFYRDPQTLPPSAPASQLSSEPHSFSRVFSAAFLDALAGMFRKLGGAAGSAELAQASQDMGSILVGGVLAAPVVADYYSQVAAHMIDFAEGAPFNGKYRDVLTSAFVRRGILSLQAGAMVSAAKRGATRAFAAIPEVAKRAAQLPFISINASQYGLKAGGLRVAAADEPRSLAVTSSSLALGPLEPTSGHAAAESYTEDLFQRGHVDTGQHARRESGLAHPYSFKTHMILEKGGELTLKRITFDCGFDHRWRSE